MSNRTMTNKWFDSLRDAHSFVNVCRVAYQIERKQNEMMWSKMMYANYYSQMSYAQFIEFEKQNDENARYELRETSNELRESWKFYM